VDLKLAMAVAPSGMYRDVRDVEYMRIMHVIVPMCAWAWAHAYIMLAHT
jgi:hypothetical protein